MLEIPTLFTELFIFSNDSFDRYIIYLKLIAKFNEKKKETYELCFYIILKNTK